MAKVLAVPGGPTSSICPAGILSSPNDAEDAEDAEDVGQLELKSPEKLQKKTAREGTNYIIKQTQGKEEYSSKTIREQNRIKLFNQGKWPNNRTETTERLR